MKRLNGWQRLWLVVTVCMAIWFVVLWPIRTINEATSANQTFQLSLDADFASGNCQQYVQLTLDKLVEPPYGNGNGGTCWHIYTMRTVQKIESVPFTKTEADKLNTKERIATFLDVAGLGLLLLLGLSIGMYLMGLTVGWIRQGFSKQAD